MYVPMKGRRVSRKLPRPKIALVPRYAVNRESTPKGVRRTLFTVYAVNARRSAYATPKPHGVYRIGNLPTNRIYSIRRLSDTHFCATRNDSDICVSMFATHDDPDLIVCDWEGIALTFQIWIEDWPTAYYSKQNTCPRRTTPYTLGRS